VGKEGKERGEGGEMERQGRGYIWAKIVWGIPR